MLVELFSKAYSPDDPATDFVAAEPAASVTLDESTEAGTLLVCGLLPGFGGCLELRITGTRVGSDTLSAELSAELVARRGVAAPRRSLADTLVVGNATSGTDLVVSSGDALRPAADDAVDVGTSGTRFRTIHAGTSVEINNQPAARAGVPPVVGVAPLWDAGGDDGYPAIADLDLDGDPEVILVASGTVRVLEGDSGLGWCGVDPTGAMCDADDALRTAAIAIPGGGRGGPPTIADFDGDGRPEIAAAGGSSYSVYDLARTGEDLVVPMGDPIPAAGSVYVRWSQVTQDQSSNATGSSVFDFQGDGIAEVVYADECYMRVYSGVDGTVILEEPNSSATIHEYPLVVDVDADGNSEILVVANDVAHSCGAIPDYVARHGVFSYGDAFDRWVQTRRVWTSHTYHVTNATSAGNHPPMELDNWTQPGLNNYRQNVQGAGVFNAPDLTVELAVGVSDCLDEMLALVATVRNVGALGVPAGIPVSLYEGADAGGVLVETRQTQAALLPGASVQVIWNVAADSQGATFFVEVDGADDAVGVVDECDETNNGAVTQSAACPPAE